MKFGIGSLLGQAQNAGRPHISELGVTPDSLQPNHNPHEHELSPEASAAAAAAAAAALKDKQDAYNQAVNQMQTGLQNEQNTLTDNKNSANQQYASGLQNQQASLNAMQNPMMARMGLQAMPLLAQPQNPLEYIPNAPIGSPQFREGMQGGGYTPGLGNSQERLYQYGQQQDALTQRQNRFNQIKDNPMNLLSSPQNGFDFNAFNPVNSLLGTNPQANQLSQYLNSLMTTQGANAGATARAQIARDAQFNAANGKVNNPNTGSASPGGYATWKNQMDGMGSNSSPLAYMTSLGYKNTGSAVSPIFEGTEAQSIYSNLIRQSSG